MIKFQIVQLRVPFDPAESYPPHRWDWSEVTDSPHLVSVVGHDPVSVDPAVEPIGEHLLADESHECLDHPDQRLNGCPECTREPMST